MRFIVDFYRYIILLLIAITIIAIVFVSLMLATGSEATSNLGPPFFIGGIALIIFQVMAMGIVATFISIHDRHAEIVDEIREIRIHLTSSDQDNSYGE